VQFKIPVRPTLSDDTELTLATCESVIETGAIEPENVATQFLRWFKGGRIHGIGSSTLKAMRDLSAGTHWALSGARGEFAAGNGAAMRIAPLAFLIDPNNPDQRIIIRDVCRITHHNEEAYVGALAVVLSIHAVLTGEWSPRRSFLASVVSGLPDSAVRDRILEMLPLEISIEQLAHRFSTTGYVVDTVPFALYCAQSVVHEDLEVVLSRTISAGGDTDTIGSITGQIAGTVVGLAGVPHAFFADIEQSEQVGFIAHAFAEMILRRNPTFVPSSEKQ
jgi:ADP-ribosyl-[dinitrogen reductase] hydrolase